MKASKLAVCVFVDCAWGAKHGDMTQKYHVTGFPTVVYTDCEGEEVARMGDRSSDAVLRDLNELVKSR